MKKIVLGLLLSMTFFSCSKDETKTQDPVATRSTLPVLSPTVQIGTQVWMTSNLNVSRYSDGTPIPQVTNKYELYNLTAGGWCYYNYSATNGTAYGKLYNWAAVAGIYDSASLANPSLRKKLAPAGWRIASDTDWLILTTFLGGQNIAGSKMKETGTAHWSYLNAATTNSSGFTGLPGGRNYDYGFSNIGLNAYFWSSSDNSYDYAWCYILYGGNDYAYRISLFKYQFFSVRCVKD